MNPTDELVKLIEVIVDKKLKATTLNIKGIVSSGDLTLSSMRNIRIQTGNGGRGYYNGTEIGTGAGSITGSGTTNYIPKFTGASAIGNSALIDDGTDLGSAVNIILKSAKQLKLNNASNTLVGKVFGTSATVESVTYNGLQLQPQNMVGTSAGNIYIGDYEAAPSGVGIKVMNSRLDIVAVSGATIYLGIGTTQIGSLSSTQFDFLKPLAMNSQKITGLAAGSVNGDAVRYEQLPSITTTTNYIPLATGANALGTSSLKEITSDIVFAKNFKSNAKKIYLYDGDPEGAGVTRLTLGYTGNDGQLIGTNGNLKLSAATNVIMAGNKLVFQVNQTGTGTYITDDANGTMELHVPAGQKLKVVVG